MSVYIMPIVSAAAIFFVIASLLTLPWTFYQYRKYGYFSFWRSILVASFIFYLLSAYALVVVPFPDSRENCPEGETTERVDHMQTTPFQFVRDIERESAVVWSDWHTYKVLPSTPAFYQLIFNIMLLLPLGVYIRYVFYARRHFWKAIVLGFLVSLFFEVTQLTGLYGWFACPYRLFDVDDIMANTFGSTIGFFIAPLFFLFIPKRKDLERQAEQMESQQNATLGATLFALFLDFVVAQLITSSIAPNGQSFGTFLTFALVLFGLIVIVPTIWKGQTIGSFAIRLYYERPTQLTFGLFKRYLALLLPYMLSQFAQVANAQTPYVTGLPLLFFIGIVLLNSVVILVLFGHIVLRLLQKKRRFYFDEYGRIQTKRKKKEGEL